MAVEARAGLIEKKAISYLLSHFYAEDVTVRQPPHDLGIDLMIELPKDRKHLGWTLAVEVKAFLDVPSASELNRIAAAQSRRLDLGSLVFPLILCAVEVRVPR